jgi:hypothetical protein
MQHAVLHGRRPSGHGAFVAARLVDPRGLRGDTYLKNGVFSALATQKRLENKVFFFCKCDACVARCN